MHITIFKAYLVNMLNTGIPIILYYYNIQYK